MSRQIYISVTNDLHNDQRVHKTCLALTELGWNVRLIGIRRKTSQDLEKREYACLRMPLIFEKKAFFYAEYQIRLFFKLLFKKTSVLYANDLDSLPAMFILSKIKHKALIYDTHEYFTEVPELQNRKAKKVWLKIEAWIFPKLHYVFTVCDSIAEIYESLYGVKVHVIRNLPLQKQIRPAEKKHFMPFAENRKLILYQGAVNIDRGLEEAVEAMVFLPKYVLCIIGKGDILETLRQKVKNKALEDRVFFLGSIPFEKLFDYTLCADLGLSIEKNTNLNYTYCLPNKLFDYIQAEIPVLCSNLPEMKNIVESYQVGEILNKVEPELLAEKIRKLLESEEKIAFYKTKAALAKQNLCWEKEKTKFLEIINQIKG